MEYGMNSTLKVHFTDLQTEILESIEFIFKQDNKYDAEAIKYVVWHSSDEESVEPAEVYVMDDDLTTFYIPFTKEETFKFRPGKKFFIDARIHYVDVFDNPEVPVVAVDMLPSLFGEGDH